MPEFREVKIMCAILNISMLPGQLRSRAEINGRTGHLTMTQLTHAEMQDCLSWCV